MRKGEEVIIEGHFGIFTIDDKEKDIVLIAGGVGVTPFISLIKDNLDLNVNQNILLLYGSRSVKDIIFKKELDRIKKKWFKKVYILSDDESTMCMCERGFVDKALIEKYAKDIDNSLFYMCGIEQMKKCVKEASLGLDVKKQNMIIEDFFWT